MRLHCGSQRAHPAPAGGLRRCTRPSRAGCPQLAAPHRRQRCRPQARSGLRVVALDAAMPFDFEARASQQMKREKQLRVAIIGFGTFGQFLAQRLVAAGHQVTATSRGDYSARARELGVTYFADANDLCEDHPDVVVLASSILSARAVLRGLPVQRLRRSTLFVDVLSVKVFPKQLMLAELPAEMDILCTHPMFGPDSGAGSWAGLNLMFERVRVGGSAQRQRRAAAFLEFFEAEGCEMVEMPCEEHDRHAASTQFITHTVGRVLGQMAPASTPIDTRGYQSLLALVDNTANDSFELYYGLFMYNPNATEELKRLEAAFDRVRQGLFGRLHDVVREQIFLSPVTPDVPPAPDAEAASGGAVPAAAAAANGSGPEAQRPASSA